MYKITLQGLAKTLLINAIRCIKDEDYQRRIWFRDEGPDVSSYGDACVFFIEHSERMLRRPNSQKLLGDETYALLEKLYHLLSAHFREIDERIDPDLITEEELFADPKWHEIMVLADALEGKFLEYLQRSQDGDAITNQEK